MTTSVAPSPTAKAFQFETRLMPKQRRFMESTSYELLFSGAFGAGKSRVLCEKGLFLSLKYPDNVGLIARKTLVSLKRTTLETFMRWVCPPELIKNYNKVDSFVDLVNGSRIWFIGIDEAEKIGGLEVGWAALDEAVEFEETDYMMVLGRVRLPGIPFRQVMIATNPGSPSHWLHQRFYDNHIGEVIESTAYDNVYNPETYLSSLEGFTGVFRERYVLGRWIGFEGLVYDSADPDKVLCEPFIISSDWRRWRTIDFGYTNPFVCQFWARHPDPKGDQLGCHCAAPYHEGYYLYREIYYSQRTVDQHAILINTFKEPISATFSDWDSGDRALLERSGILSIKANKAIMDGIQTCYQLFSLNRIHIFKGATLETDPVLKELHQPVSTMDELALYKWARSSDADFNPRTTKNPKEMPQDKDNHGMDAMRYLLHMVARNEVSSPTLAVLSARSSNLELNTFGPSTFGSSPSSKRNPFQRSISTNPKGRRSIWSGH